MLLGYGSSKGDLVLGGNSVAATEQIVNAITTRFEPTARL
jgi:hypothetical protein